LKVLVVSPGLATRLSKIEGLPEDVEFIVPERGTDEELVGLAGDVDVIVATRLSDEVARAARGLRLLQKTGAGVDAMPFDSLGEHVYVANTSGANPVPLAEGAVALVLALAKRVVPRHTSFTSGRDPTRGVELRGKKAGILGLGSIGIEVARRLQAFEMGVLGIRRRPSEELRRELGLEFLGGPGDLDFLLGESDFLVVTVPLTPVTRGMIGERELGLMKPTSYLVNVARAAIIQDEPLTVNVPIHADRADVHEPLDSRRGGRVDHVPRPVNRDAYEIRPGPPIPHACGRVIDGFHTRARPIQRGPIGGVGEIGLFIGHFGDRFARFTEQLIHLPLQQLAKLLQLGFFHKKTPQTRTGTN